MSKSGGGAATAGGMDFQHRVAAWAAVHVLAEKNASLPWDLPAYTTPEWLRCETEQPVDDLLVGTSANGVIFAQIKRTLELTGATGSDLASALDQFVRQFVTCQGKTTGTRPWDRPLNPEKDRLVLITSPTSSIPIRFHLRELLHRLRCLVQHQVLDDAAANDDERRALSVVQKHLQNSWRETLGTDPFQNDLRALLSLIYVQTLDLDVGGTNEQQAKQLLRQTILQDPDQAEVVWSQLITLCARFAQQRSGADRIGLQRELLNAGIGLKAAQSYQRDIERLRNYSTGTFAALEHLAHIRLGPTTIKIRRPCAEALQQALEHSSMLVVGEPGAGKSGAIHDLMEALTKEGRDCVFLPVDRLAAQSLGQLRQEVGLDHELCEVLDNWPGLQPGCLIIDALDAARGDTAQKMIQDLIRQVIVQSGRWRVVASIRKFDLRYGVEIKDLFAGAPSTEFQDPEFRNIRHLNVPRLAEDELGQVGFQSAELHMLITDAPAGLHDLLCVPFNLRLMADLLGAGVSPDELAPITTQLELLDRYWLRRVIRADGQGDAREAVLREGCEKMVEERALRVDRSAIARAETSVLLNYLLSAHVITEWQSSPEAPPDRSILAFSHNVLFDYAVARLLLSGSPERLVHRLVNNPNLVVMIRPSLLLHFRNVWKVASNRHHFWDLAFRVVREPRIPEIGKLIGPSVAVELTRTLSDLEPLCEALDNPDPEGRKAGEQALHHVIGALLAGVVGKARLQGPNAGPWCDLLERVSRNLQPTVAYTVRPLLRTICDRSGEFTAEQRAAAGKTARRLLEFAWSRSPRDSWLAAQALQSVCQTFDGDPAASAMLIRRCLEPLHLSKYGFEEMPWLAREVEMLMPLDVGLVEEIYRVAFQYQESSDETTPIGHSRILPMTSNRRQDYQMALYVLAEAFPHFLDYAPEGAIRVLIIVMEAYVAQRHPPSYDELHEETFDFDGFQAHLRTDYSAIWDEGNTYRHDEPLKMLQAFQQRLESLAGQEADGERLRRLVQILIAENRLAVFWRRLLFVGTRFPTTFGKEILPLAWAMPILTGFDTTTPVGGFLREIFPALNIEARQRVERTILSIPETILAERREAAEHTRDRLLGCLADQSIVTIEARNLLEELRNKDAIPPNEPSVRFSGVRIGSYGEEEYLADEGVPVEAAANRRIRELERPVKEFADKHLNSVPALEEVNDVLPGLQALRKTLAYADVDGVHPKLRDYAWGHLAAACGRIARTEGLMCDDEPGASVRDVLLEASHRPEPTRHPEYDGQFDEFPSWGSPATRIESAAGLVVLARQSACARHDIFEAIECLSTDSVPAVRFQIAQYLNAFYDTAPELMWLLIERMSREEPSRGVLQGLLGGPLNSLAAVEPDRISDLTKAIFDRVGEGSGADKVRKFCLGIFAELYIWQDHALCREVVLDIARKPTSNPDEAFQLLTHLRSSMTYGPIEPPDPKGDDIRRRALYLLESILHSARDGLRQIEGQYSGVSFKEWSQHDQKTAQSLLRLIDGVGSEVYFASGAYDGKRQGQHNATRTPNPESERFYREVDTILDEIADAGLPSVTHHLLETLEFFVSLNPRGVFLRIGCVVRAGQQGGYQYESLAADLIVKLVERYLAEYRTLLREDEQCRRTLVEILDVFVQAGWPSARRLAYRLEDIFR